MNYLEVNKIHWNQKVDTHLQSEFYAVPDFLKGQTSLNEIESSLLGNLEGKKVLHLQCHFGQDSISLARLGAEVTGVDFSEKAIERANELAESANCKTVKFICSDVYSLPAVFFEKFDLVFSSYGTIGWLPDIQAWAKVVSHFIRPGGKFVFAEFHPVVWMFDDEFEAVHYRYFNSGPIEESESATYADRNVTLNSNYIGWNHGLAEVIQSLLDQGLTLQTLREYDFSPHNCFKHTFEAEPGKFRLKHMEDKIPMVYSLVCVKSTI
jgi:ubiquinone/menaquinone biosynthesis C-methylase UbiE